MKSLICGCCGLGFKTWEGYQDQDQDAGYGICQECQGEAAQKETELMNDAILMVQNSLKGKKNFHKFIALSREKQEQFVFQLIENKVLTFKIR